jgi:hypothetical protein
LKKPPEGGFSIRPGRIIADADQIAYKLAVGDQGRVASARKTFVETSGI